ncbi:MAG: YkgJ family cysteine cluster protein [Candidatus Thiodiazotropha sp. (ex Troendleina suluensis)]|nr:YkgJ family cysteine cluster protein [Candidatus Thiodiazotropha sp. (ex Troendleina suluensis)]MCU7871641.1 YkgJ family cysteine cluster protein [Candidatus Thiodiazotropha sp. (ex Lucinoma borealis)]
MTEQNRPKSEIVEAEIRIGSRSIHFSAQITNQPVQPYEMLPLFQNITDKVIEIGIDEVVAKGKQISCRSGCGACCSQLVPVSRAEAVALIGLVDAMPSTKQAEVRARFSQSMEILHDVGILDELDRAIIDGDKDKLRAVGLAYFNLNLPCPFLENQSCSIHPDRPLSCREFLVVSDPAFCAKPDPETIESVVLPKRVSAVLYAMCDPKNHVGKGFLPLVQILANATSLQNDQSPPEPAIDLLNHFLKKLAG